MLMLQELPPNLAMEIALLGCWNIWMQRNSKIFKSQPPSVLSWKRMLTSDLLILKLRIKTKFEDALQNWIDQYLT